MAIIETHGNCRLCGEPKPLIKKSHIIPDFMYDGMFDDHHQLHKFEPVSYFAGKSNMSRPSSGEYEGGLLCADCDNKRIGHHLEDYAAQFLYSTEALPDIIRPRVTNYRDERDGFGYTIIENADYTRFKLFLLSILWRASISNRKFFDQINLGELEDVIRHMILNNDPQYETYLPIVFYGWLQGGEIATDMLLQPTTQSLRYGKKFIFPIGGIVFHFYTDIEDVNTEIHPHILKVNGQFTIWNMSKEQFDKFVLQYHGM